MRHNLLLWSIAARKMVLTNHIQSLPPPAAPAPTLKCFAASLGAVSDTNMSGAKASPSAARGPDSTSHPEGMSTDTMGGGAAEGDSICSEQQQQQQHSSSSSTAAAAAAAAAAQAKQPTVSAG
jgi:hypothetical protein